MTSVALVIDGRTVHTKVQTAKLEDERIAYRFSEGGTILIAEQETFDSMVDQFKKDQALLKKAVFEWQKPFGAFVLFQQLKYTSI